MYNQRRINSMTQNTISQPRKMHIRYAQSADYPPENTAVRENKTDRENRVVNSQENQNFSPKFPVKLDAEALLLTAIIVLLISENADRTLILALVYILAS